LPPLPPRGATPPPRTPPVLPATLPPPPATRVEDIAERPTRLFPGGDAPAPTTVGGGPPTVLGAPGRGSFPTPPPPPAWPGPPPAVHFMWMRQAVVWAVVGSLIASFFLMVQRARHRSEAEKQVVQAGTDPSESPSA